MSAKKEPSLFILMLLVSFASTFAVLYTPALPQMAAQLNLTSAQAQLTMTVFLIGYALGMLPYGPLSNRFGRKPPLLVGILLALISSLLMIVASRWQLFGLACLSRFLMALGSSAGIKMAFTMVGDVYPQEKATKKISLLILAFAIAPGVGIALGGLLTERFGWESCFYFLTAYSVLLFLLSLSLPETCAARDLEPLNVNKIKTGYLRALKNPILVTTALMMGCGTSVVYLFASEAPFIGMDRLGLTPDTYGVLNFIPPMGMIIGSLCSRSLAGKKSTTSTLSLGSWIALFGSAVMLLLFLTNWITVWTLFLPMPFIYIGLSFIYSNASALAMSHAKDKSNASAIMNFINLGVSVVAVLSIESLPIHPASLMPLLFVLFTLLLLLLNKKAKQFIA